MFAGCALENVDPKTGDTGKIAEPLTLTAAVQPAVEGILEYNTVVVRENPTTLLERGDFHAYEFAG